MWFEMMALMDQWGTVPLRALLHRHKSARASSACNPGPMASYPGEVADSQLEPLPKGTAEIARHR